MWRYFSVSTDTWGDKVELFPTDSTGGAAIGTGTSGMSTFKVKDKKVAASLSYDSIRPLARALVSEWDGNAVYAGFIVQVDEDLDSGTVTLRHEDVWRLWSRRYMLAVHGDGAQSATDITFTDRTLATLANRIVAQGLEADPAERYSLPMIFTADVAGANSRRYEGFKFMSVEDALHEVMSTNGGPDVAFDVRWALGTETLEFVMRSGDLTSGFWEWDATAPKTEVSGLTLKTDASKVAYRVIGTGEGSERKIIVRDDDAFDGTLGPALERVESYSDISDGAQLQARTTADLNANNAPTQQLSFKIPVTGKVKVGDLILGGTCRLRTSGLYFLTEGQHDWRLIQFDFDRKWITLQMQQIGG